MSVLSRRSWFKRFGLLTTGAAAAAAAGDLDALLWVPGQKTLILPPTTGWTDGSCKCGRPHKVFDPELEYIKYKHAAAKAIADQIDANALRAYRQDLDFYRGECWAPETVIVMQEQFNVRMSMAWDKVFVIDPEKCAIITNIGDA